MRIALVGMEVHKHGGVPLCVAYLLENLRDKHEITVFSNQLGDIDTGGFTHYHIPAPGQPRFLRQLVFILWFNLLFTILRLFRKAHFDIVHSAGEEGGFSANVITSHFCQRKELEALRHGLVRLPNLSLSQKLRALDYNISRRMAVILESWFFGRDNGRLRTVVSHQMKKDFQQYYSPAADSVLPIPNGVDIDEFHPRLRSEYRSQIRSECGLLDSDFILFFIGGDWERKGVPQAIETLAYIPDENVKLLVVGMGDVAYYRLMAEQLGVGSRVTFVTRFVRQSHYYAASDVFLFPTQYEPFGLVILEAMATGVPVVTSAIAGAADYLQDGKGVILVEDPRNARLLASKVEILRKEPEMYQQMSAQARATAEKMSWEAITEQYQQAYQSLLPIDLTGKADTPTTD